MATLSSCTGRILPKDNWEPQAHRALVSLIKDNGIRSKDYDPQCRPYAVFDYDNTTVINDISLMMLIYQIEHFRYAFPPADAYDVLTSTVSCRSPRIMELAADIASDYSVLYEMVSEGLEPKDFTSVAEYLDFRAKLWTFSQFLEYECPHGSWTIWMPSLLRGMTRVEARALASESIGYWMEQGRIWEETWESPDGKATIDVMKGLALPQESVHLYKALKDNGIDVYICSASMEFIVEAMACDPKYGLDMDPEMVYGIRMKGEERIEAVFDPAYEQPYAEGKVRCIDAYMAPEHCGRQPILVCGDSNGDYAMLTEYPDLQKGLIIKCDRSGGIAALADTAAAGGNKGKYILQARSLPDAGYIPSMVSVEL